MKQLFQKHGSEHITSLIRAATENGSRTATVSGAWEIDTAIRLPSDFTLILQDCHLRMADGCFSNMFVNEHHGTDFDHPNVQSDFRVLYDEDESAFDSRLADDPALGEYFPIRHVLPVRLMPAMGSIRASDDGFEKSVNAALRKVGIEQDFGELSDEESDYLYEQNTYAGHRIGGYPCFEQFDPRYKPELQKYDTLLLQIVSHTAPDGHGHEQELIMFGDEGGCQFFIPAEKLRNRDFSDVMYTWDCG